MAKPFGPWSALMLDGLRERGLLKVEAYVAFLWERKRVSVQPSAVSRWFTGSYHLPADHLPHLVDYIVWLDRGHTRSEAEALVYGPFRGEERAGGAPPLDAAICEAERAACDLQRWLADSRDPAGPGGSAFTTEERQAGRRRVQDLRLRLLRLEQALEGPVLREVGR